MKKTQKQKRQIAMLTKRKKNPPRMNCKKQIINVKNLTVGIRRIVNNYNFC